MISDAETADSQGLGPAKIRYLKHAPIAEALIDFRINRIESLSVRQFDTIVRAVEKEYPTHTAIHTAKISLGGLPPVTRSIEHEEMGVRVESGDRKTFAQFRIDGFTLNRLEPYTSWEQIYPEAMRLWRMYCGVVENARVKRLATRYINRLPVPIADLRRYLTASPTVPPGLPQSLRAYLTRIVIHDATYSHSAIVTQSFEPEPVNLELVAILLDIDAFKEVDLPCVEHEVIGQILADLRQFKNQIFFNSITQLVSERFE